MSIAWNARRKPTQQNAKGACFAAGSLLGVVIIYKKKKMIGMVMQDNRCEMSAMLEAAVESLP